MKTISITLAILTTIEGLPLTARPEVLEGISQIFTGEGFEVTINDGVIEATIKEEVTDEAYEKGIKDLEADIAKGSLFDVPLTGESLP